MIGGMDIHVVPPPKRVKRSWTERMFTRPWAPLVAYRTVMHPMTELVKDGDIYHSGGTVWMTEPEFLELMNSMK